MPTARSYEAKRMSAIFSEWGPPGPAKAARWVCVNSLDDFVSLREQARREGDAERIGCLAVQGQLEDRRLLDRQAGGCGTAQHAHDIEADASVGRLQVRTIGQERARARDAGPAGHDGHVAGKTLGACR